MKTPLPPDALRRLETLHEYEVVDSPPDQAYDGFTLLAAQICQTPIALISLIDADRQTVKSRIGIRTAEIPREISVCMHALHRAGEVLEVRDLRLDPRFAGNPAVSADSSIRFYAGVPLAASNGQTLGTLCVMDHAPRELTQDQKNALLTLSRQVTTLLDLRCDILERQRAGDALRIEKNDFELILDNLPLLVCRVDRDLRFRYINKEYNRLFGISPDEMVGRPIIEAIGHEAFLRNLPFAKRALAGKRVTADAWMTALTGETRFGIVTYVPDAGPDGIVQGYFCLVADITEIKGAESALRQSEGRTRMIIDMAPDAVISADDRSTITGWNPQAEAIFGWSSQEAIGRLLYDLIIPPDFRDAHRRGIDHFLATGEGPVLNKRIEISAVHRDGHEFPVELTITPVKLGAAFAFDAFLRDITERKRAERALRESEVLLRIAGRTAKLGGWSIGFPEVRMMWSDEVFAIHGLPPGPVPGFEQAFNFYAPEWRETMNKAFEACILRGTPFDVEAEIIAADGRRVWVRVIGQAERDAAGTLTKVYGAFQDISEGKRAETDRQELEAQLRQSRKMEAIGQLAGGVAHDFNNMLTVILGYTEMALTRIESNDPGRAHLEQVRTAALHSADLTAQLLAFARRQSIQPRILDLNASIASALKMLGRLIGEDVELIWKPAAGLSRVKMDPAQIDQILVNLTVNARDAIAGVGKIIIATGMTAFDESYCETHLGAVPGRYVMLAITDDGCGMNKETQERVFEPFYTTKELGKGTGLGLATVFGIVQQNAGFIHVYSEIGQGTTFRIYLPPHEAAAQTIVRTRRRATIPTGTETVLLVEDELALRQLCCTMLERLGYTVLVADTPADAIRLAREHPHEIHLLMTDVVMPKMNGGELWQRIEVLRPAVKCLFVSGYTADVIADRGVLHDDAHFLEKPFSVDALSAKLREVLSGP